MARVTPVPITGAVLKWALDESGYNRADFVAKFKPPIDDETLQSWIEGAEQPSKTQFNRIVDVLKRPSTMFFLADPPDASLPPNFRHAPGPEPRDVTPSERFRIRWALQVQDSLRAAQLEASAPAVAVPRANPNDTPQDAARAARKFVGVTLAKQREWKDADEAFKQWRRAFEDAGVVVLLLQLGDNALRGFSWPDALAPLIAVNTGYNTAARTYTLAHELGHLVAGHGSSCWGFAGPGARGIVGSERWCEAFASEFLLPTDEITSYMLSSGYTRSRRANDPKVAERIAREFNVSIRAAAVRLIDLAFSPNSFYAKVVAEYPYIDRKQPRKGGKGRNRVELRASELGARGSEMFIDAVRSGTLEKHDSLDVLQLHPDELPAFERKVAEVA